MNPRPNPTPTTAAPFLKPGTAAMQSAESICSGRIPCGAVVNFAKTAAALPSRAPVSSAALAESAAAVIRNKNFVIFAIREYPLAGPTQLGPVSYKESSTAKSLLAWASAQQDCYASALYLVRHEASNRYSCSTRASGDADPGIARRLG